MSFYLSNSETRPTGLEPLEFLDAPVAPPEPGDRPDARAVVPDDVPSIQPPADASRARSAWQRFVHGLRLQELDRG